MKTKITALQIADSIDILECKKHIKDEVLFADKDELLLKYKEQSFVYIFRYGTICVHNLDLAQIGELKRALYPFCSIPKFPEDSLVETVEVKTDAKTVKVDFNSVYLIDNNQEKICLTMLNASQSVALDYYAGITEQLLEDTRQHTNFLEAKGKLDISGRTLKKYIGKVLNVKNQISENLYIFDSPDVAWDDEDLNKLNVELKKKFDLKDRYQTINQQLNIVKENLELFKDIMYHRESSRLEWIIIILILVEVIDMFILKIFK
ncbi:RMD1 family protein [Flagellimonas flava]|uniref:RMD1 family protein n=1 Tax=Flagellimonas flava TaxID=570519 RepID=UPI003D65F6EE